jgi:DNA-binding MarR family transcriptional regulator
VPSDLDGLGDLEDCDREDEGGRSMYQVKMGNSYYDSFAMLRQTYMLLEKLFDRRCQRYGVTSTSMEVLYTVMQGPKPMSAYFLARILGREHHSVVELVNRLRRKGLLTRVTVDGKSSLEITDKARDIISKSAASPQLIEPIFSRITEEDLQQLQKGLAPIREAAMRGLGLVDMGEIEIPAATSLGP